MFPWKEGKNLVWEYTCADTLAWSHVPSSSKDAGKAAKEPEKKKLAKYDYLTRNYTFMPIACETMGSWGSIALKFIKELGGRIAEKSGEPRSTSFLFQTLSIVIQRGNAASVISSLPQNKKLDEIFDL